MYLTSVRKSPKYVIFDVAIIVVFLWLSRCHKTTNSNHYYCLNRFRLYNRNCFQRVLFCISAADSMNPSSGKYAKSYQK